jgi:hypothetical protein
MEKREMLAGSMILASESPEIEFCPFEPEPSYDWNQKRILLHNLACYSSEVKTIDVYRKNGEVIPHFRPTIHQFLICVSGLKKSSLMTAILDAFQSKEHPTLYVTSPSPSGIMGTIEKDLKDIVPPLAYMYRTLLIDEFNVDPITRSELISAFLPILENEISSRKLGIKTLKKLESQLQDREDMMVRNGVLQFSNLRCNHIFATMKNIRKNRSDFYNALLSRTIPILMDWTRQDLITLDDNPDLHFHKIDLSFEKNLTVEYLDYVRIRDFVASFTSLHKSCFLRTINDCVRCFAILGKHDLDLYDYIIRSRMLFAFSEDEENEFAI